MDGGTIFLIFYTIFLIAMFIAFVMPRIKRSVKTLSSAVPGHEGPCKPTWINQNQIYQRMDGGYSGMFKSVYLLFGKIPIRVGEEFHGILKWGSKGTVTSTIRYSEGDY